MPQQAWLVSRELADLAGPWDERLRLNQDGEYFCRVVSTSELVKFHRQALSYYRIGNTGSISGSRSQEAVQSALLSFNCSIDRLLALETSDATKAASVQFLQSLIDWLSPEDPMIVRWL